MSLVVLQFCVPNDRVSSDATDSVVTEAVGEYRRGALLDAQHTIVVGSTQFAASDSSPSVERQCRRLHGRRRWFIASQQQRDAIH